MRNETKSKKELIKKLVGLTKQREEELRKMIERQGVNPSEIRIVNTGQFLVKYVPEVMEELFQKYGKDKVLKDKGKIMNEGFDLVRQRFEKELSDKKVESWNIYCILLNCTVPGNITLNDDISIEFFGGRSGFDYVELLSRIFFLIGPPVTKTSAENFEKGSELIREQFRSKNPVSILSIKNIYAENYAKVWESCHKYVDDVILCLSMICNSSIELGGFVVTGKIGDFALIFPTATFFHPNPTYLRKEQFILLLRRILENLPENHLIKLILTIEKDALSGTDDDEFAILKRWSALEYLAESYDIKNPGKKILTKESIDDISLHIKNEIDKSAFNDAINQRIQNYVNSINYKNTKEKVKSLLDYVGYEYKKIEADHDEIDLIYRYRNCITHHGGCSKFNGKIIVNDCPKFCKESIKQIKEMNEILSKILTHILGFFIKVQFGYGVNPQ